MSDIKLFQLTPTKATELKGTSVVVERSLQSLIEKNMECFLGVRFLASEYTTTGKTPGRIDSLGLDENGCPVIVEYKRAMNVNVIIQGLYYMDWLLDHRAEFERLVEKRFDKKTAEAIEWTNPRLICIAGDFNMYDEHAVRQNNRNISLIRHRYFGENLLLLELVNATAAASGASRPSRTGPPKAAASRTVTELLGQASADVRDRFESLKGYLLALGDDVQLNTLKYYFAFKRLRNFACVEIHPQAGKITVFVKLDPTRVPMLEGFTRDVREVGHFGTGDVEITIASPDDLERARPLLLESYESD